jgi:hypothetical protein
MPVSGIRERLQFRKRIMQRRLSILPMLFVLAIACFSNAADNVPMEVLHKAAHITPSLQQLAWQEMEFNCFVHFGMDTFTDLELGTGTEDPKRFNPTALNADRFARTGSARSESPTNR